MGHHKPGRWRTVVEVRVGWGSMATTTKTGGGGGSGEQGARVAGTGGVDGAEIQQN
jgi:hypothetical protein